MDLIEQIHDQRCQFLVGLEIALHRPHAPCPMELDAGESALCPLAAGTQEQTGIEPLQQPVAVYAAGIGQLLQAQRLLVDHHADQHLCVSHVCFSLPARG